MAVYHSLSPTELLNLIFIARPFFRVRIYSEQEKQAGTSRPLHGIASSYRPCFLTIVAIYKSGDTGEASKPHLTFWPPSGFKPTPICVQPSAVCSPRGVIASEPPFQDSSKPVVGTAGTEFFRYRFPRGLSPDRLLHRHNRWLYPARIVRAAIRCTIAPNSRPVKWLSARSGSARKVR